MYPSSRILPCLLLLTACTPEAPAPAAPPEAVKPPVTGAAVSAPAPAGTITPQEIPAGYDFPGDRAALQALADKNDTTTIRVHAWRLWAGMTADSTSSFGGTTLPIWDTWCGTEEVFQAETCGSLGAPSRGFVSPTQFFHGAKLKGAAGDAPASQVASFNKYNPSMAGYLAAGHPGPGGATYDYRDGNSLVGLNGAWPAGTSIADRKLAETPYVPSTPTAHGTAAIETKPVMFVVQSSGLTPVPLWQGPSDSTNTTNPDPATWKTCVLVDPSNTAGASTAPVPYNGQPGTVNTNKNLACDPAKYLYAPLATLYNFQLDTAAANAFNVIAKNSADSEQGVTAEAGDHAVLVAMHVNTKEIEDWTWQTFWWQPGTDTPESFPGSKADMDPLVKDEWRNYAMCANWLQTEGKDSTEMQVCFNPFLETSSGIPAGITSNCMSCHGAATAGAASGGAVGTLNYPTAYTAPIDFDTDPMFASYTRTDFSWAIPSNASAVTTTAGAAAAPTK